MENTVSADAYIVVMLGVNGSARRLSVPFERHH
jgi:hypothetical protein